MKKSPLAVLREFSSPAPRASAKVGVRMDRPAWLVDDETDEVVRFTIAIAESERDLLKELGEFYDSLAKIQGRKRVKKWKINRLVQRMISAQIDALSRQMGVDLRDAELRAQKFAQATAEAEKEAASKKKIKR